MNSSSSAYLSLRYGYCCPPSPSQIKPNFPVYFSGVRRRNFCFPSAFGKIIVKRSWPLPLDSRRIWASSSGKGRQVSPKRSGVCSIPNSSTAGTANTNRTPPSSKGSAKINWLFHSPSPATEAEELADRLSPTDADWKTGNGPPDVGGASAFVTLVRGLSRSAFGNDVDGDNVVSLFKRNLRAFSGRSSGGAATAGKDAHRGH